MVGLQVTIVDLFSGVPHDPKALWLAAWRSQQEATAITQHEIERTFTKGMSHARKKDLYSRNIMKRKESRCFDI